MDYDVIVIGSGPGGLTAALYSRWLGMSTVILSDPEKISQLELATKIDNIPGNMGISGIEYIKKLKDQVTQMGTEIKDEKAVDIQSGDLIRVFTNKGEYISKCLIISTGAEHRKGGLPGEEKFLGRGVSYCAICDAVFYKGRKVIVWGGGDTAMTYATYLAQIGCDTTLVHRRKEFRASEYNVNKAKESGVKFILERSLKEIKGDKMVSSVILDDGTEVETAAVFVAIGETPSTSIFKKAGIEMDEGGFIKASRIDHKTNISGIFAVGDATQIPFRQVVLVQGDAALAAYEAYKIIKLNKEW